MITRIRSPGNPAPPGPAGTPRSGLLNLRKGDVIRGEIVRDYGKGDVEIRSGGAAFRAFTTLRVREGGQYDFRVKVEAGANRPAVLERVATKVPRQNLPALLSEITSGLPLKDLSPRAAAILRNLSHAIPANLYPGPTGDSVSWLSRFLTDGGLFWESKVARELLRQSRHDWRTRLGSDLKGMLLELRKSLESERRDLSGIEATFKKVDEALDLIQTSQMENRDQLREEGCWALFVPGRPEEGFKGAELHVRRDGKGKEIRFALFLDFSRLGPMQVTASILESTLTARIEVSEERDAEFVRMGLPLLEDGLKRAGLVPGPLSCLVRGTEPGEGEPLQKRVGGPEPVDLVI